MPRAIRKRKNLFMQIKCPEAYSLVLRDASGRRHSRRPSYERRPSPLRHRQSMDDVSHYGLNAPPYNACINPYASAQPGYMPPPPGPRPMPYRMPSRPGFGPNGVITKEVWRSPHPYQREPERDAGDEVLSALRFTQGGIMYRKINEFQHLCYTDRDQFFRFNLVPEWLIPPGGTKCQATEIDQGWVRREALSLLGYAYSETPSGRFSISGDLEFVCDTQNPRALT